MIEQIVCAKTYASLLLWAVVHAEADGRISSGGLTDHFYLVQNKFIVDELNFMMLR